MNFELYDGELGQGEMKFQKAFHQNHLQSDTFSYDINLPKTFVKSSLNSVETSQSLWKCVKTFVTCYVNVNLWLSGN